MKVLMTNGTTAFLRTLKEKHPEANIRILENATNALAYYEGNNTDLFVEERIYETVDYVGDVKEEGFVVMNHIPVTDEGRPIFEDRFKNRQGKIESMPGFQALRVLKPASGHTYVVFTQWDDERSFQNWVESSSFQEAHKRGDDEKEKKPPYSAGPSYVHHYRVID
ncbi:antibiotic biosynthesis monooxygenase family protein [Salirhabdus sp. Marseille-P4669]|uniref:antibiotic biosynthesis monooxygenase family protein n=1 Tax=Salirhabdus sp. Marseille-P4669 TaxID=2042310 RepID=UPI000C7B9E85|nr:antibiotic biosynthesis monooxygenase [Salirhabdus sp. Marseille-P4669]